MSDSELFRLEKRDDQATQRKRQSAANVLQNYSLLAMNALKDNESPAKTRLKMMRIMTDLPPDSKESMLSLKRNYSSGSIYNKA